ncbi:hypothetical protein LV716_11220 [Flagellimonas sp. HMM57]|uniref:hypothetical protein n=1 Tax=unclassified Flagellimonas TaxID=2644544 RepID=UPI0013D444D3|nr:MULTISPECIES: hypothetical protein [unclassified Flagellimonas]UII74835.1 hypothetical protein LV716_11220 [Flagellimonas sp. HMM57]
MRRLVTVLVLLATIGVFAQRHDGAKQREGFKADLTVEQMATLHTKKMTLALDLTERQQQRVMEINLEQAKTRKAKREERKSKKESGESTRPTTEERYALENERLDNQIVHHQKMKEILTDEQYDTWKKMALKKTMNGKKKMREKGRRG